MRVLVAMDGDTVVDVFAVGHHEAPPEALEVDVDRATLGAESMVDYALVNGRLIRSQARIAARRQAQQDAAAARLARIATAKANMAAAQSVPQLRDAVATLFAELGL